MVGRQDGFPSSIDTSPCTYGLRTCRPALTAENQARFDRLRLLDVVEFLEGLLPRLTVRRRLPPVALHPVCSAVKMGLAGSLEAVASACSERAVTPPGAGCCGMAGDRALMYPALGAAATAQEVDQVRAGAFAAGYSSSRTCEVNLSRHAGITYRSVVYLLEVATRAEDEDPD